MSTAKIFFEKYLTKVPLSLALQRSVEAKYIDIVKLNHPVVDIGCGFGEFAEIVLKQKIDLGVDIDSREIDNASKTDKYKKLIVADARALPIKSGSVKTVFSISTFEHINNPREVLDEVYRILAPGGKLVTTLVLDEWEKSLFYPNILRKLHLYSLAKLYVDQFNRIFKHQPLKSKVEWDGLITKAGFKIVTSKPIAVSQIAKYFDLFLITAWPAQIIKLIWGKRMVYRPPLMVSLLSRMFAKYTERESTKGTNLFLVAIKEKNKLR